jgi:tetratricopeptide (TPR) repeat protein
MRANRIERCGLAAALAAMLLVGCQAPGGHDGAARGGLLDAHSEALFMQSLHAIERAAMAEAERLLLELTQRQPSLVSAWVNLGNVLVELEREQDAHDAFHAALALQADACGARIGLGVMARRDGSFSVAEAHYRACLDGDPTFREAHLNLGILYELYLGRLNDALKAYRAYQALLDDPDPNVRGWIVDLERRVVALGAAR